MRQWFREKKLDGKSVECFSLSFSVGNYQEQCHPFLCECFPPHTHTLLDQQTGRDIMEVKPKEWEGARGLASLPRIFCLLFPLNWSVMNSEAEMRWWVHFNLTGRLNESNSFWECGASAAPETQSGLTLGVCLNRCGEVLLPAYFKTVECPLHSSCLLAAR